MSANRPIALVTGASSGIGASFADQLGASGYNLVLVARRRERLEQVGSDLVSRSGASGEVVDADLSDAKALARVEARASKGDIELLVNAAGFPGYRPFIELDPHVADDLLALHVRALTRLTRAVLPAMVERGRGGVINVGSLLALSGTIPPNPLPYRAVYAGAKAYVLAFTQALAGELKGTGVRLQALLPGVVATEFHDSLNMDRSRLANMAMKPDEVVAASLAALHSGEVICVPGLDDPALLDKIGEAQRGVMQSSNRPQLAARYKTAGAKTQG